MTARQAVPIRVRLYVRVALFPRKVLDETLLVTSAPDVSRQTAQRLRALADEIDRTTAEQEGTTS